MLSLGNVVTYRNISFESIVEKYDSFDKINNNNPTLLIGWEYTKKLLPNVSVIDKKINDNLFWTFDRFEKRSEYEKDIDNFYKFILLKHSLKLNYSFVNILAMDYTKTKRVVNFLKDNTKDRYIFIDEEEFIYVYEEDKIIGISLNDLFYSTIKPKKIIDKLKRIHKQKLTCNTNFISPKIKDLISSNKIIIPFLFSLYSKN